MVPASIPPGWYFDGNRQRWWTGSAWGQVAPDSNDRSLATLAHLGGLLGGFLLPLVLYLTSDDDRRPQTRRHAREALNFQLTSTLAIVIAMAAMFTALAGSGILGASGEPEAVGAGIGIGIVVFVSFFALLIAVSVADVVFGIIAAVRAHKGNHYRYPFCLRFVADTP